MAAFLLLALELYLHLLESSNRIGQYSGLAGNQVSLANALTIQVVRYVSTISIVMIQDTISLPVVIVQR